MGLKNAAAVILCAGNGTRMNDDSLNKVCFDCAGVPVIKRIVENMKAGGVDRFVIVVGHRAEDVMNCLCGTDGIVYAYQKEQKGTGHAALCGLNALGTLGYGGPVIISMGDKIIAPDVISGLIEKAGTVRAVWGVQPISANPNGGRVVTSDGKPYGVVEFADAALMALAGKRPEEYCDVLKRIGLNPKKAEKVLKKALEAKPSGEKILCGRRFTACDVLNTGYANAGLYCFDTKSITETLLGIGSDNAQGEAYLTDALECFASRGEAALFEVSRAGDMLTYSTKPELRLISREFMRTASEIRTSILSGEADGGLKDIYGPEYRKQADRYIKLLDRFIERYGDKKAVITRAPGRINLMGRHIDHRGGGINVMAIDRDTVFVVSPRDDDTVNAVNTDPAYADGSFGISETAGLAGKTDWLGYLENGNVVKALADSRGSWINYIKSAVIRAQFDTDMPLVGMDMAADGTIPVAAGLSSSSSIVVAVMEAVAALNSMNMSDGRFTELCGEGEWFVGSRGGAGDHAAMKNGRKGRVVHLGFKPFRLGRSAAFSDEYSVIVANSMLKAKKAEGSRDKFNAKVASYEFALMLIRKAYPQLGIGEFRDLAAIRPYSDIYRMLKCLPETATRADISELLKSDEARVKGIFSSHADPGAYDLRGVCLYGISECARSERFITALEQGDYALIGKMMNISHNGDRICPKSFTDDMLDGLAERNADIALECGGYGCSAEQIDELCDMLNATEGVLGSELVGAGLGGCVIALAESARAEAVIDKLDREYYDKHGYPHSAYICAAACGSSVMF